MILCSNVAYERPANQYPTVTRRQTPDCRCIPETWHQPDGYPRTGHPLPRQTRKGDMNRTFEYRLYVRARERALLVRLLEEHREIYNAVLQQIRNAYQVNKQRLTALNQWPYFRDWRKQDNILANASSVQHTLRRVDK